MSSTPQPPPVMPAAPTLGSTEWKVVLISVDMLFAAFAAARLAAASEGGRKVLRTAGLTYAEYARSGFFELLAVASLTLVGLLVLRSVASGSRTRAFSTLGLLTIGLTLVVVASALQRLYLYQQAFGMTLARLYSAAFCLWLASALVVLAVWIARGARRSWFWAASGAAGLAMLLALNLAGPERIVVGMNVEHASRTGRLDAAYLVDLGDAALPAIEQALSRLPSGLAERSTEELCASLPIRWSGGWPSVNAAHEAAVAARARVCGGGGR